ncbi:MAG: hypothetical protein ACKVOQ_19140 [Cyclobacteriaceae bacterium]
MARFIAQIIPKPKTIFLVDGLGAFATASILFLVQGQFQDYFGMPSEILSLLSIIAFTFTVYSILCFLFLKKNWGIFLKAIMTANLLYCYLTTSLLIHHRFMLTNMGLIYFIAEIVVIGGLVFIESQTLLLGNQKKGKIGIEKK